MSRRIPIEQHILSNSPNLARVLRTQPQEQETFKPGVPAVPAHLSASEKEIFAHIVSILSERGTLTSGDCFAVERFATLESRRRFEQAAIAAEGTTVEILIKLGSDHCGTHRQVANPRLKILQAAEKELGKLEIQLGLTPKSRASSGRTKVPQRTAADELAELDKLLGMEN